MPFLVPLLAYGASELLARFKAHMAFLDGRDLDLRVINYLTPDGSSRAEEEWRQEEVVLERELADTYVQQGGSPTCLPSLYQPTAETALGLMFDLIADSVPPTENFRVVNLRGVDMSQEHACAESLHVRHFDGGASLLRYGNMVVHASIDEMKRGTLKMLDKIDPEGVVPWTGRAIRLAFGDDEYHLQDLRWRRPRLENEALPRDLQSDLCYISKSAAKRVKAICKALS